MVVVRLDLLATHREGSSETTYDGRRLDQLHGEAVGQERVGSGQAGHSRTDHDRVDGFSLRADSWHRASQRRALEPFSSIR